MAAANLDFQVPAHLQREFVFQTAGILPPNGILFGFNTIKKVGEQAKKLGGKQALLVTDEIMVQLGYADLVKGLLEKEGIKVDVFGKVDPEPHMETADLLFEMVKKAKSDLVIGLGGGSAMDMAKMTSILATNEQTPMELMTKKVVANPALKKILIPTTSGTGSEVSKFFVASKGHDKYFMGSHCAYPEIAIIDPGLTVSMPPRVTASTGIDALSHAVESLMNKFANPWTDSLGFTRGRAYRQIPAPGHLQRAGPGSPLLYVHGRHPGNDVLHRHRRFMRTVSLMCWPCSSPTAHGIGCGVGLPYTMAFNLPVIEDKLALIARAMGEKIDSLSAREAGKRAVELVYDLTKDVKMPVSLKEMGFRHEDVPKMAEICITKYPRPNNPRPMSKEDCLALFEAMWQGDVWKVKNVTSCGLRVSR